MKPIKTLKEEYAQKVSDFLGISLEEFGRKYEVKKVVKCPICGIRRSVEPDVNVLCEGDQAHMKMEHFIYLGKK